MWKHLARVFRSRTLPASRPNWRFCQWIHKDESQVRVTIREGKFHQVKRMVAYCGKEVVDLQRLAMGTLVLDENLKRGEWRRLTKEELEVLLASVA